MVTIEEYIEKPIAERQSHLRLDEPCMERSSSGKSTSTFCKGLLAHIFDTTIPKGMSIHVCHACNNEICSNPDHLYWGTAKENRLDQVKDRSIWERNVHKNGLETAIEVQRAASSKGGRANAGKPKSPEHRAKLALAMMGKRNRSKGI